MSDLTDSDRVRLIVKALEFCGQEVTDDAISIQFRRETGREAPSRRTRHAAPEGDLQLRPDGTGKTDRVPAVPEAVRSVSETGELQSDAAGSDEP